MPQTGQWVDPFTNFNFTVQIDGLTVGCFSEPCRGYSSTVDLILHNEGGRIEEQKLPGLNRFGNVVLRRGLDPDRTLYGWHLDALRGDVKRHSGSIIVQDRQGDPDAQFDFVEAWLTRMTGPALNAEGNEVAIEEFELAVEGLERVR
jgi:phage tail-like protein